jgi:phosphatidyl-myo-inositol dimannoside synthase
MTKRRMLLASAGLDIGGGIANLAGSTLHVLEGAVQAGVIGGLDVLVLHGSAPTSRWIERSITSRSRKGVFLRHFAEMATRKQCDLILFDSLGVARPITLLPQRFRPPYLVFAHGQELDPPLRRALLPPLASARDVVTVSPTSARKIRGISESTPLPPIRVIPPCVARDRIDIWEQLTPPSTTPRPPTVLSVGRMIGSEPGKGHDTLIRAMPIVRTAVPGASLILVGEGDHREPLRDLASRLRADSFVTFAGSLSDHDLGVAYQSASVFAMPSQQEGFGIVYAEAMWFGLPCVGSTADAAVDVIDHGKTGLLVEYGDHIATADALIRLLNDSATAKAFGANGRDKCMREYTPEVFESRLLAAVSA